MSDASHVSSDQDEPLEGELEALQRDIARGALSMHTVLNWIHSGKGGSAAPYNAAPFDASHRERAAPGQQALRASRSSPARRRHAKAMEDSAAAGPRDADGVGAAGQTNLNHGTSPSASTDGSTKRARYSGVGGEHAAEPGRPQPQRARKRVPSPDGEAQRASTRREPAVSKTRRGHSSTEEEEDDDDDDDELPVSKPLMRRTPRSKTPAATASRGSAGPWPLQQRRSGAQIEIRHAVRSGP